MKDIYVAIIWALALAASVAIIVWCTILVQHKNEVVMSACLKQADSRAEIQECGDSF